MTSRSPRRVVSIALVIAATALAMTAGGGGSTAASAAAANPPVTAGLQLWFEADTETAADGAPVSAWADKSGFARNLTAQPGGEATMRRNAVNGRAAVEFNGSTSLLKTYGSTFTIAQPDTFFLVYRSADPDTSARAFVFDSTSSNVRQVFGRSALHTERMYANIDMDASGIAFPFAGYQLWSGTFNGASSSLFRNGTSVLNANAGSSSLSGLAVGGLSTSGPYGYDFSHSLVAELLIYSGTMTAAQRQSMVDWLNEKYAVLAPPSPPVNSALPAVNGSASDGATLIAGNGTWSGTTPMTFAYQWQRCTSAGTSCAALSGATNGTYAAVSADVGATLRVVVTATNSAGSASATSPASPVVAPGPPVNTALPAISGSAVQGQLLTASNGTWSGTAPFSYAYEWRRCDAAGSSCLAVSAGGSYTPVAGDVGATLRVAVTASNTAGSTTAVSAQTATVSPPLTAADPPPVSAGLQMWFDANQEAYADGAAVTKWTDRSGFGRDLTAFDGSAAATFRRNAVNGRAAVDFNGTTSLLKTYGSTFTIAQPDTFFIVFQDLDTGAANIFDSRNSSQRQSFGRTSTSTMDMYADVDLLGSFPGFTIPFPSYELWYGAFNGSSSTLARNGTQSWAGRAGSASQNGFTLGALSSSGQYGYQFSHARVAEVLWYSGALTAAEQSQMVTWLNGKYAFTAPPSAPANTTRPQISGAVTDGSVATVDNGRWSGSTPMTFAYQWQRCTATGTSCVAIAGATVATYTLTPADIGNGLVAVVTATNSLGSASVSSTTFAPITAAPPANSALPAISGSAIQDQVLTASTGTWAGTAPFTYAYQWRLCDSAGANCTSIGGATSASYTVLPGDVGSTLRVDVTATNSVSSVAAESAATTVVTGPLGSTGGAPPVTAGLQMWFDASQETLADGAAVTTWTDRSSFARDLTAFTPSAAATFRRNAINGRSAIEFNGSSSLLKTYGSTFTIAQPDTFFIVYRQLDAGEAYIFDSRNSAVRQLFGRGPSTDIEMYADVDLIVPNYTFPFPTYELWAGTYNGNQSVLTKNGTTTWTNRAGASSLDGFTVGALSTSGEYGYLYSHSLVAEILWYSGNLSSADRTAVTNWLKARYAMP
ncbi:MAG: large repetitive protein [Gaiellaceae bacterium]|nr:large repetitive protein [Gaiellaceae bacterium]